VDSFDVIPAHKVDGFEVSRERTTPAARELYNTDASRGHRMAVR
jgi:hypothetical protein